MILCMGLLINIFEDHSNEIHPFFLSLKHSFLLQWKGKDSPAIPGKPVQLICYSMEAADPQGETEEVFLFKINGWGHLLKACHLHEQRGSCSLTAVMGKWKHWRGWSTHKSPLPTHSILSFDLSFSSFHLLSSWNYFCLVISRTPVTGRGHVRLFFQPLRNKSRGFSQLGVQSEKEGKVGQGTE